MLLDPKKGKVLGGSRTHTFRTLCNTVREIVSSISPEIGCGALTTALTTDTVMSVSPKSGSNQGPRGPESIALPLSHENILCRRWSEQNMLTKLFDFWHSQSVNCDRQRQRHAMPRHATSRHATPRRAMPCH